MKVEERTMTARPARRLTGIALGAVAAFSFALSVRGAEDGLLTGIITSPSGAPIEGVVVSAQIAGEPITASVYTGVDGRYFFPLMKGGHYNMWAQAVGLERAEAVADLRSGTKRVDFKMKDTTDIIPQLSGYQSLTALPEDTVAHRRGKLLLQRNCTYCHESATVLRDRFDQHGWETIIGVMLNGFNSRNTKPLTAAQKELAAYLTDVRGPESAPLKVANPEAFRPKGEATLPVVYEYDVEYNNGGYSAHNGSDWRFGQASSAGGGGGIHDATMDFLGNIWFTSPAGGSENRTVAMVDTRTGKLTDFAIRLPDGKAAMSHGIYLDRNDGKIYFNASPQIAYLDGDLGIIDPKANKVEAVKPPEGMSRVSGWLGGDGKGYIWTASGTSKKGGALRFDPKTKTFKQLDSPTAGLTYGIAGDKNGNGWWMGVNDDIIVFGNPATGEISEITLPEKPLAEFLKPGDLGEGEQIPQPGLGGNQSPRRPYADFNGKDLWITNYRGNTLVRIDVDTKELKYYWAPFPGMNPYEALVDSKHQLWVTFQNSDEIGRFDPAADKWSLYSWPTRGMAQRNNHWVERDGVLQLISASGVSHRVGRMVIRSAAEVQALRAKVR
jgi:streptogramin lyase